MDLEFLAQRQWTVSLKGPRWSGIEDKIARTRMQELTQALGDTIFSPPDKIVLNRRDPGMNFYSAQGSSLEHGEIELRYYPGTGEVHVTFPKVVSVDYEQGLRKKLMPILDREPYFDNEVPMADETKELLYGSEDNDTCFVSGSQEEHTQKVEDEDLEPNVVIMPPLQANSGDARAVYINGVSLGYGGRLDPERCDSLAEKIADVTGSVVTRKDYDPGRADLNNGNVYAGTPSYSAQLSGLDGPAKVNMRSNKIEIHFAYRHELKDATQFEQMLLRLL